MYNKVSKGGNYYMGITIIADAVSNLFQSIIKNKNLSVKVMNMHLTVGDHEYNCYNDPIDISEFSKTYFALIEQGEKVQTSLINSFDYIEVFKEEIEKGNKVICFCMAQGISGTYQSALQAAEHVNKKHDEEMVYVIDTMTAGLGEGLQAIHADELVKQGKTFDEIKEECELFKKYVRSDFTVDNIKYLIRTGRASKVLAKFINLLNIKVLLKHNKESKIAFAGTVPGRKNSIKKLSKLVTDKIDREVEQTIYITHCNCIEDAQKIEQYLREDGLTNPIEIYDYDLISGAHIGPRSLAVFYISEEEAD